MFFYANAAGSRVYFNDLGPPWPKHECTDNPRRSIPSHSIPTTRPTRRKKGEIKELLNAASVAGLSSYRSFGQRSSVEWSLVIISAVSRFGEENLVEGEFLDSETNEKFRFSCYSEAPMFEAGGFVSVKGNEISFIDPLTLLPMHFVAGAKLAQPDVTQKTETAEKVLIIVKKQAPKPKSVHIIGKQFADTASPRETLSKDLRLIAKASTKAKRNVHKQPKPNHPNNHLPDLSEAEMVHFNNKRVSLSDLFSKLESVVKIYAREGIRKPRDVSHRLNEQGYKTASGSRWTPRLVYFLLRLMFNEKPSTSAERLEDKTKRPEASKKAIVLSPDQTVMSVQEMAKRLSHLGKVVGKISD